MRPNSIRTSVSDAVCVRAMGSSSGFLPIGRTYSRIVRGAGSGFAVLCEGAEVGDEASEVGG